MQFLSTAFFTYYIQFSDFCLLDPGNEIKVVRGTLAPLVCMRLASVYVCECSLSQFIRVATCVCVCVLGMGIDFSVCLPSFCVFYY
jgi:hypothetical protein